MILIDLSQCIYSIVLREPTKSLDFAMARGMIYTTLLSFKRKFESEFGEPILAADSSTGYWRDDVFPYYKAARRANKKKGGRIDWGLIEPFVAEIHAELRENMPWKYIQVPGAEADDVIGCLGMKYGASPTLILSSDKDYAQLQLAPGIRQYSSVKKEWIVAPNPKRSLQELILLGDVEDGIPNMLSDADTFVTPGKRQKAMTAARISDFFENMQDRIEENRERYEQNRQLIDFTEIPREIRKAIYKEYNNPPPGNVNKLFKHFVKMRLSRLASDVSDFQLKGNK